MDPVVQTPVGSVPVFQGTEASANDVRNQLNKFFGLFPPGTVMGDDQRRANLVIAVEHVAKLTTELAVVQATVPGRVGRLMGPVITGVEKDPGTGKVRPGSETVGNFLPSPLGFLDPTSIGLPRNFYLPSLSTEYIPPIADKLGIGLPEQRAEDEKRRIELDTQAKRSDMLTAQRALIGENNSVLADLAGGRLIPFSRASVLIGTSGASATALRDAAISELARRNNVGPSALLAPLAARVVAATTPAPPAPATPGVTVGTVGSVPPLNVKQVNDAGLRNARDGRGIAHELVHERADP